MGKFLGWSVFALMLFAAWLKLETGISLAVWVREIIGGL